MQAITVKNLSYTYNPKSPFEKAALKDVTFSVEEGEFFGIIGHTGSGKSTLVQHFNALIKPQSGLIKVAGYDLTDKKTDFKALRGAVGMVFQYPEYQLFAETVEKDVAFGLRNLIASDKRHKKAVSPMSEEQIAAEVKQAIETVGLNYEEIKDKSPFDLSGGQKRRVAIAGVIVTKPKVLVLDEPSAGLDPQGKQEVLNLILDLQRTCTPTIVMISHDMDEIARYSDRIAVLSDGKLAYLLPPKELFLHEEQILELGLDVPVTVKIAKALRDCGYAIEPNIVDPAELANAIAQLRQGEARA